MTLACNFALHIVFKMLPSMPFQIILSVESFRWSLQALIQRKQVLDARDDVLKTRAQEHDE